MTGLASAGLLIYCERLSRIVSTSLPDLKSSFYTVVRTVLSYACSCFTYCARCAIRVLKAFWLKRLDEHQGISPLLALAFDLRLASDRSCSLQQLSIYRERPSYFPTPSSSTPHEEVTTICSAQLSSGLLLCISGYWGQWGEGGEEFQTPMACHNFLLIDIYDQFSFTFMQFNPLESQQANSFKESKSKPISTVVAPMCLRQVEQLLADKDSALEKGKVGLLARIVRLKEMAGRTLVTLSDETGVVSIIEVQNADDLQEDEYYFFVAYAKLDKDEAVLMSHQSHKVTDYNMIAYHHSAVMMAQLNPQ